jgi:Hemerythrin HHE cation binding domain
MSLPQSIPSLFGRFTAILKDHGHLGITLRQLKALCAGLEDSRRELPQELHPPSLLAALRLELAQHFRAEESAEYFGTVVAESPPLAPGIAELKSEHAAMLDAVDSLLQLAADPGRWAQLPQPTRLLVMQLERHEASESKLLRDFFFSTS